jgi:hypothetical protein
MTIDDLTPALREEIQEFYVRSYFARIRRREHDAREALVQRFDAAGRRPGEPDATVKPRLSQDVAPRGSQSGNYRTGRERRGPCPT